jgi:hypothetical protein
MAVKPLPLRKEIVRPRKRCTVAGPAKALMGPRNLSQALNRAVPAKRRRAIAQARGSEAQAQKLTFAPSWRALVVRQFTGGSLHDLQHALAHDPLYAAHGARLEISVPGLSKAKAQRPSHPFWEVRAEVRAAIELLPRAVRIGRERPLGAANAQTLRQIARLLNSTHIFDATTIALPPQVAAWARVSEKREQAGIKVQLRVRAGYGGVDRVIVTGAAGTENPYFRAWLDREEATRGQLFLFDTGYFKLATSDQVREHGCDLVTVLHENRKVEVVAELPVECPVTAPGYVVHSDRIVYVGSGNTRSEHLWRLLDATDTQGRRRTLLTSLLSEPAERITRLRAYRWTIAMVFRWLNRVLQLDELISVSPAGIERQVAVALIAYGVLLLYQAGGTLSLKAIQRHIKTALHEALFAAGVEEGERRAHARAAPPRTSIQPLRKAG